MRRCGFFLLPGFAPAALFTGLQQTTAGALQGLGEYLAACGKPYGRLPGQGLLQLLPDSDSGFRDQGSCSGQHPGFPAGVSAQYLLAHPALQITAHG